jgi:hypothetical protein
MCTNCPQTRIRTVLHVGQGLFSQTGTNCLTIRNCGLKGWPLRFLANRSGSGDFRVPPLRSLPEQARSSFHHLMAPAVCQQGRPSPPDQRTQFWTVRVGTTFLIEAVPLVDLTLRLVLRELR